MSYYLIIATAGHDTTSGTVAGGLLALMQNPAELTKLQANPDLLPGAVEEMLRWVSPVKHFFRTATEDYTLRGKKIKAGQSLMMCYPSANRDEEIFQDPCTFKSGPHTEPASRVRSRRASLSWFAPGENGDEGAVSRIIVAYRSAGSFRRAGVDRGKSCQWPEEAANPLYDAQARGLTRDWYLCRQVSHVLFFGSLGLIEQA